MTLAEKAAYLKGLADGLKLDESSDETKLIKSVIDVISDMALTIDDIEKITDDLSDTVDEIDEALADVQDELYGDYDDECDFDECDDYDDGEDVYYEVTCPTCGEVINVEEDVLLCGETKCPKCGEALEFDLSNIVDECGCDCGECEHD